MANGPRAQPAAEEDVKDKDIEMLEKHELERDFGVDSKAEAAAEPPLEPGRRRLLLLACACILGNELCERLAYYGVQVNMGLYLKKYMGYPADEASQLLQVWKATVYLTPLLGAFLADAYMGRFWVILVFSIIYFIGLLGITVVNLVPGKPQYLSGKPSSIIISLFWLFMYLTALGSGGIKPCVSSFGGDQFRETSARERRWRSSFFNWFYFVINIGSLVATLVVVPLQETKGYGIGFGIPTICFFVAIVAFVLGAIFKLYTRIPPEGSPLTRIWRVLAGAFSNRKLTPPAKSSDLYEPLPGAEGAPAFRMAHTDRMKCLDRAAINTGKSNMVPLTLVEETKAFAGIMPIFFCVIIFQMCYDPIFTLLPYPGDVMDRSIGSSGFEIPASSISFANTFGVLLTVALYDLVIVPLCTKCGRPISMVNRIGMGFVLQIIALASAALIEMGRYKVVQNAGLVDKWNAAVAAGQNPDYLDPAFREPMSIWWQFIPYFLTGAAEVFTNIGTMELFYTQVSEGMRALGTSFYLLTVAIGTYLATALNIIIAAISPNDLWVADNPLFGHYDWYFWVNVVILALALIIFYVFVARKFTEKPILKAEDDPFNTETRLHAELANVSKAWPSISRSSRVSELRARSSMSSTTAAAVRAKMDRGELRARVTAGSNTSNASKTSAHAPPVQEGEIHKL